MGNLFCPSVGRTLLCDAFASDFFGGAQSHHKQHQRQTQDQKRRTVCDPHRNNIDRTNGCCVALFNRWGLLTTTHPCRPKRCMRNVHRNFSTARYVAVIASGPESRTSWPGFWKRENFRGYRDWLTLGLAAQVRTIPGAESTRPCGRTLFA